MPREINLFKVTQRTRVGISFYPEETYQAAINANCAVVARLNPNGLAFNAGLRIEDCLTSINGVRVLDPLSAAKRLRESVGELRLTIERQNDPSEAVGDAMRAAGQWITEVLTPRGGKQSLIGAIGMGWHRMLAGQEKHDAATKIGSHWRGFRMRELCNTWWWAASDIQQHARGWHARHVIMPLVRAEAAEAAAAVAEAKAAAALKEMDAALAEAKRKEEAARQRFLEADETVKAVEQAEQEALTARSSSGGGTLKGIKRALSFNSKKKRRPSQQAEAEAEVASPTDRSDRSDSSGVSGPSTPPAKSPRDAAAAANPRTAPLPKVQPELQATPAKKGPGRVRRTLSWTLRTKRHMAADNQKQEASIA